MATPLMTLTLPTPGVGGTAGPDYATQINAALTVIDGHDHSSGNGARVTPAGLNINAAMEMNDNRLYELGAAVMTSQSAILTGADYLNSLQVVSGELHYRDASGNDVQLTASGALNASSIGGIGGDYATSTASVTYSSSTKAYSFTQSSGVTGDIVGGSLFVYENASGANYVKLSSKASLAANVSLELPSALPSSATELMALTTGGVMASTATPTVTGLTATGTVQTDTVSEKTSGNGVAVDGTLLKDGYAPFPPEHIQGLAISNDDGADGDDINFGAGSASTYSSGGTRYNTIASAALTKQADATWAAGDDAGGLPDSFSGTWPAAIDDYHLFLLGKQNDQSAYDFGFDTSLTAVNLLADAAVVSAGFNTYRRVASLRSSATPGWPGIVSSETAGGGLDVRLLVPVQDVSDNPTSTAAQTYTLASVPGDVWVLPIGYWRLFDDSSSSALNALITQTNQTDTAPSDTVHTMRLFGGSDQVDSVANTVKSDTSRHVRARLSGAQADQYIYFMTHGWIDERTS